LDIQVFRILIKQGMTCASCSSHIERSVSALTGVESVVINLLGCYGIFRYDKDVVGIRDIVDCIEGIGFTASMGNEMRGQVESLKRESETQKWKSAFLASLFFSIPVSTVSMILPIIYPSVCCGYLTLYSL
jgi:Cu+-exporting ATPase